jgi:RimJ/RimL family protein N-acetyltransferase
LVAVLDRFTPKGGRFTR